MARRRAQHAPVGLTSNGVLIVNVLGLLPPEQAQKVRSSLPKALGTDWFLGVAVAESDVADLLERLDDAAAEAVAKTRLASRAHAAARRRR